MTATYLMLIIIGTLFGYALGIIKHKRMREIYFQAIAEIAEVKAKFEESEAKLDYKEYELRKLGSKYTRARNVLRLYLPNTRPAKERQIPRGVAQC